EDTNKLVNQYIRRLRYLPSSEVKELKDFMNKLWIIREETQDLAVNTARSLMLKPTFREKIKLFKQEGVYPWQS
ncbi:hypothetical protein, partial [Okeania hirsuta]